MRKPPHTRSKVDAEICKAFKCAVFHTAPLPNKRGGTPVQNVIIRGFNKSPVCALQMTDVLDAGPLYNSQEIAQTGNIDDIFFEIAKCIDNLILKICKLNPISLPKKDNVLSFKRLSYEDTIMLQQHSINACYDRIRMVNGEGYKSVHIPFGNYQIEFSEANIVNHELPAKIRVFKDAD